MSLSWATRNQHGTSHHTSLISTLIFSSPSMPKSFHWYLSFIFSY
jgi:hypothetical protein